jgi:hypothetical protein
LFAQIFVDLLLASRALVFGAVAVASASSWGQASIGADLPAIDRHFEFHGGSAQL